MYYLPFFIFPRNSVSENTEAESYVNDKSHFTMITIHLQYICARILLYVQIQLRKVCNRLLFPRSKYMPAV
jgi:hypothetical protein